MDFEVVYQIPNEVILSRNRKFGNFIKEDDLNILLKTEKHNVLYFLRTRRFHTLHDFPALGAYEQRLISSEVEGPYESEPKVENPKTYAPEKLEDVVKLFVPLSSMPLQLEEVSLINYGTVLDSQSRPFLMRKEKDIDVERIKELGKTVKEKFDSFEPNDYIANFNFLPDVYPFPDISFSSFGRNDKPSKLLEELGLKTLHFAFSPHLTHIGIRNFVKKGFAYDLSLDKISLSDLDNHKNIIL